MKIPLHQMFKISFIIVLLVRLFVPHHSLAGPLVAPRRWWRVAGLALVLNIKHHSALPSNIAHHLQAPVRQLDLEDKNLELEINEYHKDLTL